MIATRLPDVLRDLDRILRQEIDSELLDELTAAPREPAPAVRPDPVPAQRPPDVLVEPERPAQVTEPQVAPPVLVEPEPLPLAEPVPAALGQHLASMLHAVLGTEEITLENLSRLKVLARTAQRAEATKQRISARLRELQDSVDNAALERDIAYGNRHASTESGDVQRNPQLRAPRELPVPAVIDPSERVFMGAHFKIAQSATISPRMHYLDATSRTQKIYVGYIGPHLPLSTS